MVNRAFLIAVGLLSVLLILTACEGRFGSMKSEQFEILKQNVSQILGSDYEVKSIKVVSEGFSDENETEYIVDFTFDLNKPLLLFPSSGIPGKLIFTKDQAGEWQCSFNSGNPNELFNLLR